jgi:hypothetical protein
MGEESGPVPECKVKKKKSPCFVFKYNCLYHDIN